MIRLIRGSERDQFKAQIDQMHRLRKRVFCDRLKWEVDVIDGHEVDQFDACDPLYILAEDVAGRVIGCVRLLPTTGPNMLADVFKRLLPPGERVWSPTIWEASRFAVDFDVPFSSKRLLRETTSHLLCAMAEIGIAAGLEHFVAVTDLNMERVLRFAGCDCERLGQPVNYGVTDAVAGFWEVGEQSLLQAQAVAGIKSSILEKSDEFRIGLAA